MTLSAPSPPSLRAQRSSPECFRGGTLDCFAAIAMTTWRELKPRPTHQLWDVSKFAASGTA
ncbi:hypothetical protein C7G41_26720 [Bradyrhizobium sp. MOS002]|nr:hypothetical protein C7G41_26720 [Bradyrhizobium sp. MOS002]